MHRIKLRGGWECQSPTVPLSRRTFPCPGPVTAVFSGPVIVRRAFGFPNIDNAHERVVLELDRIAGTRVIRLNQEVVWSAPPGFTERIEVTGPWALRNVLELEVDPAHADQELREGELIWGVIQLRIEPRTGVTEES